MKKSGQPAANLRQTWAISKIMPKCRTLSDEICNFLCGFHMAAIAMQRPAIRPYRRRRGDRRTFSV
jgi:hypothetical protein